MKAIKWLFVGIVLLAGCVNDPIHEPSSRFTLIDGVYMKWHVHTWIEGGIYFDEEYDLVMRHVGYEMKNGFYCFKVVYTSPQYPGQSVYEWFVDSDTGLITVDIDGSYDFLISIFSITPGTYQPGSGYIKSSTKNPENSITQLPEPQLTLKFPLQEGEEWTVCRYPFHRTRRVLGIENVEVPAGTFTTFHIRGVDGNADDFYIDDWVTETAWVKKRITSEIPYYDPDGNYLGTIKLITEFVLTDMDWR